MWGVTWKFFNSLWLNTEHQIWQTAFSLWMSSENGKQHPSMCRDKYNAELMLTNSTSQIQVQPEPRLSKKHAYPLLCPSSLHKHTLSPLEATWKLQIKHHYHKETQCKWLYTSASVIYIYATLLCYSCYYSCHSYESANKSPQPQSDKRYFSD